MASIICYMMIRAHESKHSTVNLPYPILVINIMAVENVPFKVTAKGCKDGHVMGHETLMKMGLIQQNAVGTSSSVTLRPGPSRARSTYVKSTMMGLLHTLVRKVSRVLKN